jgi:hypothetical protein
MVMTRRVKIALASIPTALVVMACVVIGQWYFVSGCPLGHIAKGQPVQVMMWGIHGAEWKTILEPESPDHLAVVEWLEGKSAATWRQEFVSIAPGLIIECAGGLLHFPRGSRNPITFTGVLCGEAGRFSTSAEPSDVAFANWLIERGRIGGAASPK